MSDHHHPCVKAVWRILSSSLHCMMSRKPVSSSLSCWVVVFYSDEAVAPRVFYHKKSSTLNIYIYIYILEEAWLADIITHHITIHLRKACVDLGTSIAYLNHLLTARFVGFVYCEVFVAETLSEMRCLSDSVAGATESLAETRANEWEQYITRVSA